MDPNQLVIHLGFSGLYQGKPQSRSIGRNFSALGGIENCARIRASKISSFYRWHGPCNRRLNTMLWVLSKTTLNRYDSRASTGTINSARIGQMCHLGSSAVRQYSNTGSVRPLRVRKTNLNKKAP